MMRDQAPFVLAVVGLLGLGLGCGSTASTSDGGGSGGRGTGGGSGGQGGAGAGAAAGSGGSGPGAGGGGAGGAPGPISASDYPTAAVAAECQVLVACGEAPDQASCMASNLPSGPSDYPTLLDDIASGKTHYDGAQAAACLAVYDNAMCTQTWLATFHAQYAQRCAGVFTGTVGTGGACFINAECVTDLCLVNDSSCAAQCCPGTCMAPPASVPLGGDCSTAGATCVAGAFCDVTAAGSTCRAQGVAGTSCSADAQCLLPFYCNPVSNLCTQPAATGAPCHYGNDSSGCDTLTDTCAAATGTCVAAGGAGQPCSTTTASCASGSYCGATSGLCTAYLGPGASCTSASKCMLSLVCDSTGHCTLPTGSACE